MIAITLSEGQKLTARDIRRINEAMKNIAKAAEDKRGKEVLEWVLGEMIKFDALHESKFRQAYKERFGE